MSSLSWDVYNRYMSLALPSGKIQAEYIWIGGSGNDLRCVQFQRARRARRGSRLTDFLHATTPSPAARVLQMQDDDAQRCAEERIRPARVELRW